MSDINGIWDIAQKLTDTYRAFSRNFATGSHRNNDREDKDNAKCLIESIHPETIFTANTGNRKNYHNHQATPPECAFLHPYEPAQAWKQQTCKERIEQTDKAHILLFPIQCPSAHDITIGRSKAEMQSGTGCQKNKNRQSNLVELTDKQCVQDIADIFIIKRPCRPIQRVHFRPPTNVPLQRKGK